MTVSTPPPPAPIRSPSCAMTSPWSSRRTGLGASTTVHPAGHSIGSGLSTGPSQAHTPVEVIAAWKVPVMSTSIAGWFTVQPSDQTG